MIIILPVAILLVAILIWASFSPKISIYSRSKLTTTDKIIALSFDDGPDPNYTKAVLGILDSSNIKASFFVVGKNVQAYPKIVKAIDSAGHLIGNHSYYHNYNMAGWPKKCLKDIDTTSAAVNDLVAKYPMLYRPPYGLRTPWGARAIKNAGYSIITWNNMTHDYLGLPADKIMANIVKHSSPGGVIVLHDGHEGFAKPETDVLKALPGIIKQLSSQGYKFVRVDELFDLPAYKATNLTSNAAA